MAFLRSIMEKAKKYNPFQRHHSGRGYQPPVAKPPKSQCTDCKWSPNWNTNTCRAQMEIRNPGYGTAGMLEIFPKNGGNCPSYLNHSPKYTKPTSAYVVIRMEDFVVKEVLPISTTVDRYADKTRWFTDSDCWVVDTRKFPEPIVGATAVFVGTDKAELKWREPKHRYGTDVLGKTRHATVKFQYTGNLR